jgi:F-type H+-transporting ATPase subunit b
MDNPLVQPDPGLYIWTILTFLVLLALLAKFAWRPLLDALERRQDAIRKSLDDARKAREELERLQAESQRILDEARARAAAILSQTEHDAMRLRDELKQKAQAEAASVLKNAERQIAQETARALQQIRHEAVDLSIAIASKLLERHVSREDNERLIEATFQQIEAGPKPSGPPSRA